MDQRPLEPGEVRFDVPGGAPPKPSRELPGKWVIGLCVVFFLVMTYVSHKFPNGRDSKTAAQTVQVPPAPVPAGGYAVVSPHGTPGGQTGAAAIGFVHERLVILRVPPNTIPEEDRLRVAAREREPSDHVVREGTPGGRPVVVASKFVSGLAALLQARSDKAHGLVEPATLPPYILHGDVDITCGELSNDDAGYAALLLENGDLSRASISLAEGPARGPPVKVRTVYIMGNVREVHGPEQYKKSILLEKTLDLGPTDGSREEYAQRLEEWNKEIVALEAQLHVPADDVKAYAGTRVTVRGGSVVSAVDSKGKPVAEPERVHLRKEASHLQQELSTDPESREQHMDEHPVEPHIR